jgi:hypothetical protein
MSYCTWPLLPPFLILGLGTPDTVISLSVCPQANVGVGERAGLGAVCSVIHKQWWEVKTKGCHWKCRPHSWTKKKNTQYSPSPCVYPSTPKSSEQIIESRDYLFVRIKWDLYF